MPSWKPREKFVSVIKTSTGRIDNKEWAFASSGYLPLAPSLLEDMERDVKNIYHVTDIKKYDKLKRIQGRRIDIPCFTKGSMGLTQGLLTDGEVLVTLNGKASAFFEGDVNTHLDRNGLRWLSPKGNVSKPVNDIVFALGLKIGDKAIEHFNITREDPMQRRLHLPTDIAIGNWIYDKDGSTKRKFMKFYYDEAKKLVNRPLIDKINKALGWRDNQNISHNEILVHNFKIVKAQLIVSEEPDKAEKMWKAAEEKGILDWDVIQAGDIADL